MQHPDADDSPSTARERFRARAPRIVGSLVLFYVVSVANQLRHHSLGAALMFGLVVTAIFVVVIGVVVGGLVYLMKRTRQPDD